MSWVNAPRHKRIRRCSGKSMQHQSAIGWYLNFDADILHSYFILGSGLPPFPRSVFSVDCRAKKMQLTTEGES